MIPKKIHYCWFGRNPLPQSVKAFIASWRENCPMYEIKEWNESNFDIHINKYVYEAYKAKKYAFVSDYARLYALYQEGGIYLDTDIELRKSFDNLLCHNSFVGWEVNLVGTAVLGCVKQQQWVKDVMASYKGQSFITRFGRLNVLPNPYRLTSVLKKYGLKMNHRYDVLKDDIVIYPIQILCAKDYEKQSYCITEDTISIHHYSESWLSPKQETILDDIKNRIYYLKLKIKK